jgi:hypothetical protein
MNAFSHVFDPLDLEIIDRVYEAALAQLEAQRKDRDVNERLRDGLRKRVMACAEAGQFDFDTLYERVWDNDSDYDFTKTKGGKQPCR